jgi:hypothetical protein
MISSRVVLLQLQPILISLLHLVVIKGVIKILRQA